MLFNLFIYLNEKLFFLFPFSFFFFLEGDKRKKKAFRREKKCSDMSIVPRDEMLSSQDQQSKRWLERKGENRRAN